MFFTAIYLIATIVFPLLETYRLLKNNDDGPA